MWLWLTTRPVRQCRAPVDHSYCALPTIAHKLSLSLSLPFSLSLHGLQSKIIIITNNFIIVIIMIIIITIMDCNRDPRESAIAWLATRDRGAYSRRSMNCIAIGGRLIWNRRPHGLQSRGTWSPRGSHVLQPMATPWFDRRSNIIVGAAIKIVDAIVTIVIAAIGHFRRCSS